MTTAAQVVKAIGQEILVQGSEAPLEADEAQDIIFAMNLYMAAQDANGIHLGYTVVDTLNDVITIPMGALQGLIANVAIMVAPQFGAGARVDAALIAKAKLGLNAMRKLGVTIAPMSYPDTLPVGSGNEGNWPNNWHFYPETADTALTETGNNIALETNT